MKCGLNGNDVEMSKQFDRIQHYKNDIDIEKPNLTIKND